MLNAGAFGEQYAAEYLAANGYSIVCRNYRCKFGEIDIIAQTRDILAFIEVKTRSGNLLYSPREAVGRTKMRRLTLAAECFVLENPLPLQPRFDVIEIVLIDKNTLSVLSYNHIVNAFDAVN